MKVSKAVEILKKYDQDSQIIIAWWDKDTFEEVSQDDWDNSCEWVEDMMDWSYTHDELLNLFDSGD